MIKSITNTLLKSDITRRDHVSVDMDASYVGSRFVNFIVNFTFAMHSLRITLKTVKSTTLVHMRSGNAWTTKPWQR